MNRLIINTANKDLTILLELNGKIFFKTLNEVSHHNETMLPAIDELLREHKIDINKINEFGVVIGPGSFTGIRVGVSTIKAFRDALNADAKGINNLDLLFNLATNQNKEIDTVAIKGSEDSYFVARLVFGKLYKYTRNLTKKELLALTKKPIGVYAKSDLKNEFIVNFDANIMLQTYLDSEQNLNPVYYQLSQAEREKLNRGKISVCKATKKDAKKIAEIESNSIKYNTLNLKQIEEMQNNKNYQIFVCKFNDEIVGFIILQISDETNIVSIAVDENFRNLGLATKLANKAIRFSKINNINAVSLEVSTNNLTAYLLYEKLGFKLRRKRKNYYTDGSDCLEMVKQI